MKRINIEYGSKVPVVLTLAERDLIRGETFFAPDFAADAVGDGGNIKIELSLDEIEDIQGFVAASANHAEDKTLEGELNQLFHTFQAYLDKYTEEDEFD